MEKFALGVAATIFVTNFPESPVISFVVAMSPIYVDMAWTLGMMKMYSDSWIYGRSSH